MRPATAAARTTVAPRIPRRVSGPVRRPAPVARARPSLLDLRLLDRLLRGRAWIWLVGLALLGIVAMQVSLLKLNTGISRAVQAATTLERQNAELETQIARLASNERISEIAARRGMVAPSAGDVVYVRARPAADAPRAARRMTPPSEAARKLMAAGGRAPAVAPVAATQVAQAPVATPAASAPAPAATATPAPAAATPATTPAPTGAAAAATPGG